MQTFPWSPRWTYLVLLSLGIYSLLVAVAVHHPPAEDAAILYRYSENLADTGRISYNPGGERAEGATDFLWMLLIAGGYALGGSSHQAALGLSFAALLVTLGIQYRLAQGEYGRTALLWLGWLLATQQWAAVQGFSVMVWGLSLWLSLWFWEQKRWSALYLSLLGATLIRPDAFVVAVGLAMGSLGLYPAERRANVRKLLMLAVLPGLGYFAWRVRYFGQWWPLPFWVKAVGTPEPADGWVPASLRYLLTYHLRYLGPLWLMLAWRGRAWLQHRAHGIWLLGLVALPSLLYLNFALTQNVANRLVLPLLVGALALAQAHWQGSQVQRGLLGVFFLLSTFIFLVFGLRTVQTRTQQTRRIAQEWADIEGHRMAITEAGNLPYYAGWKALDLWGLNSPALSTSTPDSQLLADFDPHLIMWHEGSEPPDAMLGYLHRPYRRARSWDNVVFNTFKYAWQQGQYEIWRVPFAQPPAPPLDFWDRVWRQGKAGLDAYLRLRGGNLAPYERRDWYLLRCDAPAKAAIRAVLRDHGAYRCSAPGFPAGGRCQSQSADSLATN